MGPQPRSSSATDPRARGRRGHRHERQDDDGVPARARSSRRRGGDRRCLTNIERRVGGELRADGAEHARGDRPAAAVPRDARRRRPRRARWRRRRSRRAQGRLDGTRFAVLVFTNLTQDHLDFHGTMEEYFEAKRALFEQAERAVVNVGDEWGAGSLPSCRTRARSRRRRRRSRRRISKLRGRFNRRERARRACCGGARARDRRGRDPRRNRRAGTACRAGSKRSKPVSRSP